MNSHLGFNLTGLRLLGQDVPPADLSLAPGLNVISGPSDTGKTFALQCIDYVMGSGSVPKSIPEAARYDVALLGLVSIPDDQEYVLERALRGGGIRLHATSLADFPDPEPTILGAKHKPGQENTVSGFLLNLCGIRGKQVRVNQQGKTREISFRDLARLVLVDEQRIITTESPIHTGQYTTKTAETSVFRLLLTGLDDSGVIEDESRAVSQGRRSAQVEVVEQLITELHEELRTLVDFASIDRESLYVRLAETDAQFAAASEALGIDQQALASAEASRRQAWISAQRCESRLATLDGLLGRFRLLEEHYRSDLSRLDAIAEAGFVLEQFPVERCPVCGAPHDWQDHDHAGGSDELARIREACVGESQRIMTLVNDLKATVLETQRERREVEIEKQLATTEFDRARRNLREELEPQARASAETIRNIQVKRDLLLRSVDIAERISALETRRSEISEGTSPTSDGLEPASGLEAAEIEEFCAIVEDLLRAWHYPELTRVVFSDTKHDLVISGRSRASHGKGLRAVSHAAFIIGLLRYCIDKDRPHPTTVVLDSPLVAYREPDAPAEERISEEVQEAFYSSLAAGMGRGQVVILENEDPPESVLDSVNYIHFTKGEVGRYGFIPSPGEGEST